MKLTTYQSLAWGGRREWESHSHCKEKQKAGLCVSVHSKLKWFWMSFWWLAGLILTGRTCVTRQCESDGSVQEAAAEWFDYVVVLTTDGGSEKERERVCVCVNQSLCVCVFSMWLCFVPTKNLASATIPERQRKQSRFEFLPFPWIFLTQIFLPTKLFLTTSEMSSTNCRICASWSSSSVAPRNTHNFAKHHNCALTS